jgi:hypothetical protein
MRYLRVQPDEALQYVRKARDDHSEFLRMARDVDTYDKYRNQILKGVGTAVMATGLVTAGVGAIVGASLRVAGELINVGLKWRVIQYLRKDPLHENRNLGDGLLWWEILSLTPGFGDAMDFMNHNIKISHDAVTNTARQRIREDRKKYGVNAPVVNAQYVDITNQEQRPDGKVIVHVPYIRPEGY